MGSSHVLVIDDDDDIRELLRELLERAGHQVSVAPDGHAGLRELYAGSVDLVILDVAMPGLDGWATLERIREVTDTPVLMLTARDAELERVRGLQGGADDYVVKPFSASELVARMRAIMRRGRGTARRGPIEIGTLRLDPPSRTVTKDGEPVELAAKEFDLLHLLMANAGDVMRRETIMDEVWDPHWFGPTKTLDVHISWLRKKIEDDPTEPRFIATIRGVGFRFAAPHDMATDST